MVMMQANRAGRGRRRSVAACIVGLLTLSGTALAPIATAQETAVVSKLKAGVTCSERGASKQLMRNAASSGAALDDLLAALETISIDREACVEIRDAASNLGLDLADDDPAPVAAEPFVEVEAEPQPEVVAAAAAARMQEVLAEADRRAAAMRFEVGPPPRNLTRSRAAPQ